MSGLYRSEERAALEDSAARWCEARYPSDRVAEFDAVRWREMAEFGWLGAVLDETGGGLGLPPSLASVVAEALAPAAALEPYAAQVALAGLVLARAQPNPTRDAVLAAWLSGEGLVSLAAGEVQVPPWAARPTVGCRAVAGGHVLSGFAPLALDAMHAAHVLLATSDERGATVLFLLPASAARRTVRHALDGRAHAALDVDALTVSAGARLEFTAGASAILAEAAWLHALCLAAESVALARAMLRASHAYLGQREQFGRALLEFQVLQHRLVDMTLALTRLESLLEIARLKVDELGVAAAAPWIAAAKAAAGEEGRGVARAAVHLHGAIGLTAELALGRQMRRLAALELLGGTTAQHEACWREMRTTHACAALPPVSLSETHG